MRILVTGGAGFIGRNLTKHLLGQNHQLTVIDLKAPSESQLLEDKHSRNLVYIQHDICDFNPLPDYIKGHDAIIHLAATSDTRASLSNFRVDLDTSIVATWNVLEAARLSKNCRHFIYTSSQHVYGPSTSQKTDLFKEESPYRPISPYGASKASCELIIETYARNFELPSTVLRLSNIVGKHQNFGVLVDLLRKLKTEKSTLLLWGNGEQRRNFLHVKDLSSVISFILDRSPSTDQSYSTTYNIANTSYINIKDLAQILLKTLGIVNCKIELSTNNEVSWKGDPGSILSDISRITREGWRPSYSIRESIELATRELMD